MQNQKSEVAAKFEEVSALINAFKERAIDLIPSGMLFEVLDHTGDSKHIWDKANAEEVEAAKRMFEYFTKEKKYAAFHVTGKDGEKGEQMRTFDPKAERVIFAPQMQGG